MLDAGRSALAVDQADLPAKFLFRRASRPASVPPMIGRGMFALGGVPTPGLSKACLSIVLLLPEVERKVIPCRSIVVFNA